MAEMESVAKVTRGGVTIPARIRREAGIGEGTLVGFEVHKGRVLIRPVVVVPADEARNADAEHVPSPRREEK